MKNLLILLLSIGVAYNLTAQEKFDTTNSFIKKLASNYSAEKIHLHLNKDIYFPGDTLFFKAYFVNGIELSDLSKNLYLDIFDDSGHVIQHSVWPIMEATSFGNISIAKKYKSNQLHIVAYTRWMLNFDSSYLYKRAVPILQNSMVSSQQVPSQLKLRLFPEGGDLVIGIPSKIAFSFTDQFDFPQVGRGWIMNSIGDTVATLNPVHDGMGSIMFLPKIGEAYTAIYIDESGKIKSAPFPVIQQTGFTLKVHFINSVPEFEVVSSDNPSESPTEAHLVGTMHNQEVFSSSFSLKPLTKKGGKIPLQILTDGVLQLTLFDQNWIPVAERLFYIDANKSSFSIETSTSLFNTGKRQLNQLTISVPDTIVANLSVSVTDASISKTNTSHTITSQFLLGADLRGYIHQPANYFLDYTADRANHFDLLMLTHGWRRYNWSQIQLKEITPLKFPKETNYITLTGQLFGATENQLAKAGSMNLILRAKDSATLIRSLQIDSSGSFIDENLLLVDTVKVLFTVNNKKSLDNTTAVKFNTNLLPLKDSSVFVIDKMAFPFDYTAALATKYKTDSLELVRQALILASTLKEVVVKSTIKTRIEILEERYNVTGMYRDINDRNIDILNDQFAVNSYDVIEYLQRRVPNLFILNRGMATRQALLRNSPVRFFLDEFPTTIDLISSIGINNIGFIKVNPTNPSIFIYTRNGKEDDDVFFKPLSNTFIKGYDKYKEFYSPNHTNSFDPLPDIRTTIYWNPSIEFNKNKQTITLPFHNNDITKKFRIVIEGINHNGQFVNIEKTIN